MSEETISGKIDGLKLGSGFMTAQEKNRLSVTALSNRPNERTTQYGHKGMTAEELKTALSALPVAIADKLNDILPVLASCITTLEGGTVGKVEADVNKGTLSFKDINGTTITDITLSEVLASWLTANIGAGMDEKQKGAPPTSQAVKSYVDDNICNAISNISYDSDKGDLVLEYVNGTEGSKKTVELPLERLVQSAQYKDGFITINFDKWESLTFSISDLIPVWVDSLIEITDADRAIPPTSEAVKEYMAEITKDVLKCTKQTLTDEQKAQARENIGAAQSESDKLLPKEIYTDVPEECVNSNGEPLGKAGFMRTKYIALEGYKRIYVRARLSSAAYILAFYDKDKSFMKDASKKGENANKDNVIYVDKIPDGAAYCIVSHYTGTTGAGMPKGMLRLTADDDFSAFYGNNPLRGKKVNTLGDSITGESYISPTWGRIISERTGATLVNYGISGTTIAHISEENDAKQCFVDRVQYLDTDADAVIVMGGTNDDATPCGTWDSAETNTFFGALNTLIKTLCNTFKGKPILFCTPIKKKSDILGGKITQKECVSPESLLLDKAETATLSMPLRAAAIRAKCAEYGIPCLDLYNSSGINALDAELQTDECVYYRDDGVEDKADGLHPSAVGQDRLANLIQRELERFFV